MSAIRKLAGEAADNGLIAPELAAGIARVKRCQIDRNPGWELAIVAPGARPPERAGTWRP